MGGCGVVRLCRLRLVVVYVPTSPVHRRAMHWSSASSTNTGIPPASSTCRFSRTDRTLPLRTSASIHIDRAQRSRMSLAPGKIGQWEPCTAHCLQESSFHASTRPSPDSATSFPCCSCVLSKGQTPRLPGQARHALLDMRRCTEAGGHMTDCLPSKSGPASASATPRSFVRVAAASALANKAIDKSNSGERYSSTVPHFFQAC